MKFRDQELMDGILANNLLQLEPYGFTVTPPDRVTVLPFWSSTAAAPVIVVKTPSLLVLGKRSPSRDRRLILSGSVLRSLSAFGHRRADPFS